MLAPFDWLRLARSGPDLLATLHYLDAHPELPANGGELAPPRSALHQPCARCGLYPREPQRRFCAACQTILNWGHHLYPQARQITLVWGYVMQLPRQLRGGAPFPTGMTLHTFVHDEQHFLVVLSQKQLKPWLQELALYNGLELQGLLQVFPGRDRKSTRLNSSHLVLIPRSRMPSSA